MQQPIDIDLFIQALGGAYATTITAMARQAYREREDDEEGVAYLVQQRSRIHEGTDRPPSAVGITMTKRGAERMAARAFQTSIVPCTVTALPDTRRDVDSEMAAVHALIVALGRCIVERERAIGVPQ